MPGIFQGDTTRTSIDYGAFYLKLDGILRIIGGSIFCLI